MNRGSTYLSTVGALDRDATVLDYHLAHFPRTPAAVWLGSIENHQVLLNGRPTSPATRLRPGDRLEFLRPPWDEPAAPLEFSVLFEDSELVAVDKPAGLQVLPGGAFFTHTLLHQLRSSDPARSSCAPLHRLGRGTSGVILFGKTHAARAHLSRQFRDFSARKTYLALVEGDPRVRIARHPIGRVAHGPLTIHAAAPDGRASATRLRTLEHRAPGRSLVAAQPITGRPDQIRIHLAACGAPIVGDPLFGPGGELISDAKPGDGDYFLHAASLRVLHPSSGRPLKLRALPSWL
jgi:23S rRNA pseudouridine1911/1915/1917 synthase